MSRLDSPLCHIMRDEEKVEFSVHYFGLLNESLIDVSTLRWVNVFLSFIDVKESLSYSLVHNNQCYVRKWNLVL